jgi:hypothetical protein
VKPTRIGVLVAVAAVVGAVVYALLDLVYGSLPTVPLYAPATVAFLAIAELFAATSVRARLQVRPGHRPIDRLAVARLVALAKASALAGALILGGYAALLGYVAKGPTTPSKSHDAAASAFGVGAALLLVVAALVLERVCRVPGPPPEPPDDPDNRDPVADWHRDDRLR